MTKQELSNKALNIIRELLDEWLEQHETIKHLEERIKILKTSDHQPIRYK